MTRPYWNRPRPPDDGPPVSHKAPNFTNLSRLTRERKRLVWENIKTKNPALASLLKDDDQFKYLVKAFDAQILVTPDDFNASNTNHQPAPRNKRPP
jgi:hypothetical protein